MSNLENFAKVEKKSAEENYLPDLTEAQRKDLQDFLGKVRDKISGVRHESEKFSDKDGSREVSDRLAAKISEAEHERKRSEAGLSGK